MPVTESMKDRRGRRRSMARALWSTRTEADAQTPDGESQYKPLEWPVIRKLLGWMAPYKVQYGVALLLNVVFTLLEMTGPLFLRHLIDHDVAGDVHPLAGPVIAVVRIFSQGVAKEMAGWSGNTRAYFAIGLTIGVWTLTVVVANLVNRFNFEFNRRIGEKVILSIRKAVFAHLQNLSMAFYDRTKFGRILSRGTTDIDALSNPIINGINTVAINMMTMTAAAAMLIAQDWRIALAVLWLGPVLHGLNSFFRKRLGLRWRMAREHFTRVSTNLAENINGMRVVTAYNRQEENLSHFNQMQELNTFNNVSAAVLNGIYQPMLNIVGYLGTVIILVLGCYLVLETQPLAPGQQFTVGTLVALTMYWGWFMTPVLNFGEFHNQMMQSMASAERVFSLLEEKPEVKDAEDAIALPPIVGRVTFDHVHFEYVPGRRVLHDIWFEAEPGQTVALVGHTGCGKSTIMNLLCRFYLPTRGRVLIDGKDLTQITSESLHHQMGIVSQSNYLFSGTVLDNIRYARPGASMEEVIHAAKSLGSHEILEHLKDGYLTQVGERGSAMSLGQRQLICFTRAFLADPRILILDEATSAVDTHTEMILQSALETLVQHRTTFIVAHRLSTVTRADQVLVLDHGRIIERGTHSTLLQAGGKYAELYKQFTRAIG